MAHILIDTDGLCFCNCADKCVVNRFNSGTAPRCNKKQIKASGHRPVQVFNESSNEAIMRFTCNDGDDNKKIKVTLKKQKK